MDQLLLTDEAAKLLRVHRVTLYKWVAEGKVPYLRVNRRVLFDPVALRTWAEQNAKEAR